MKARPKQHKIRIGVLGIQGSCREHVQTLRNLRVEANLVKTAEQINHLDGLIIPGGESTTIGKLLKWFGLDRAIIKKVKHGMPVYGTCAGAILLAKKIVGREQAATLKLMDIAIERNAYGRQIDSFSVEIGISALGRKWFPAVFIRAPRLKKVGKKVTVLAEYAGEPVMAREGNILISMFHPELTLDIRVHEYFIKMIENQASNFR